MTDIKYENGSRDGVNRASELSRGLPRARDVKGPDQEKMETEKDRKGCQEKDVPRQSRQRGGTRKSSRERHVKRKSRERVSKRMRCQES